MGRKLKLRDLCDAKVQAELKDDTIRDTIKNGRKSPSGSTLMKPAEGVSDEDIRALVQHVRSFKP
jgi:cytochrome c551/c552